MDCVFCKIRDGQIPSAKVYEDDEDAGLHGHQPAQPGPLPGATKAHAATVFDAEVEDLKAAMATAKRVAGALRKALKPDGLNLLQANGAAAFQSVPHFHLHLIPALDRRRQGLRLEARAGQPGAHHEAWASASGRCSRSEERHGRAEDPSGGGQAGARRARPGRQDRGARAPRRGLRGHLHGAAPDARSRSWRPRCRKTWTRSGSACSRAPTTTSSSACSSCSRRRARTTSRCSAAGIIPQEDIRALKAMGVKELFTPGTSTQDIIRFVRDNIRAAV